MIESVTICVQCRYKVEIPLDLVLHTHYSQTIPSDVMYCICIITCMYVLCYIGDYVDFCPCSLVMKWRFTDCARKQMDAFLKVGKFVSQCYVCTPG